MGENFMSANTQISDLLRKKNQIIDKVASLLSEAILDRIQNNTVGKTTETDIKNSIRGFSSEEQVEILTKAMVLVSMNKTSKTDNDDNEYDRRKKIKNRSDIFGRYDD